MAAVDAQPLFKNAVDDDWSDLAVKIKPGPRASMEVLRMHAPEASAVELDPAVPLTTRARSTAPVVANTVRGDRALALASASTAASRQRALDDLTGLMVAPSAAASQDSLLRTWHAVHFEWFGSDDPVLPLTSANIYAVCAMFRAGGYRAVDNTCPA